MGLIACAFSGEGAWGEGCVLASIGLRLVRRVIRDRFRSAHIGGHLGCRRVLFGRRWNIVHPVVRAAVIVELAALVATLGVLAMVLLVLLAARVRAWGHLASQGSWKTKALAGQRSS